MNTKRIHTTDMHIHMTQFIETKISEIRDKEFHAFLEEFCGCLNWNPLDFQDKSLANLFSAIEMQGKTPNLNLIPFDSVLSKRVKDLSLNSAVYCVCCELINRNRKPMDDMIGNSVFQVIRKCYKAINPPMRRSKRSTRMQDNHAFNTMLISRRRSCGSL